MKGSQFVTGDWVKLLTGKRMLIICNIIYQESAISSTLVFLENFLVIQNGSLAHYQVHY